MTESSSANAAGSALGGQSQPFDFVRRGRVCDAGLMMVARAVVYVVLLGGCAGANARGPEIGHRTEPSAEAGAPAAPAVPARSSIWNRVFEPHAVFELSAVSAGEPQMFLRAEVVEVRGVGQARVARLSWTFRKGSSAPYARMPLGDDLLPGPYQIAESSRGIAFFGNDASDEKIARFIDAAGGSEITGPGGCHTVPVPGCNNDRPFCTAEICVAEGHGIVSLGGSWSVDGKTFRASK